MPHEGSPHCHKAWIGGLFSAYYLPHKEAKTLLVTTAAKGDSTSLLDHH